jgi:hypothetical protein
MKLHSLLSPLVVIGSAIVPILSMSLPAQSVSDFQPTNITSLTLSEVIVGCGNECAGIKAVWGVKTTGPKAVSFVVKVQEQAPCIGGKQCRSETINLDGLARSAVTKNLSPLLTGSVVGTFKVTVIGNFSTGTSSSASKIQSFNLP